MATSELTPLTAHPQFPTEPSPRVALYARVSTEDKGQDYTNQLRQLREFAARQGWTIVVEFSDTVTGGTSERVEFQRMFQAASRREFDVLLFWSLDRISLAAAGIRCGSAIRILVAGLNACICGVPWRGPRASAP